MRPNREAVSLRIRNIKEKLGLSIAQMAEKVGTSKTNLNAYLRGVSLPPEKIAENISRLGGYSEDWVYYGDNLDYVDEFLLELGFEEIIKDYPFLSDEINEEYKSLLTNQGFEDFDRDDMIQAIIMNKYNVMFELYVSDIIKPFIKKMSFELVDIDDKERYINRYILRVKNLVKKETPVIKYGHKDRIYSIAEEQFNMFITTVGNSKKMQRESKDIVELFANSLSSEDEIQEFLKRISNVEQVKFNPVDIRTKKLITMLHNFGSELISLMGNSNKQKE